MQHELLSLSPTAVWKHFYALTQIPRPSKNEKQCADFIVAFGKQLGLPTTVDEIGNVLICKPASKGMENAPGVILQSHLDMVPQKNESSSHNFKTDPILPFIDGEFVKAKDTTLGADNGMGVAMMMAILEDNSLAHPPLNALFTIDEETGMTGAKNIRANWVKGNILINLDTEEEGELCIGCAGGIDGLFKLSYTPQPLSENAKLYHLNIKGLKGGHSGCDIHLNRANANLLYGRLMYNLISRHDVGIVNVRGGNLRNAIPRECFSTIVVPESQIAAVGKAIDTFLQVVKAEYAVTEGGICVEFLPIEKSSEKCLDKRTASLVAQLLKTCPNGVIRMSDTLPGLVETSNNLAIVRVEEGTVEFSCLLRSSVESAKQDAVETITALFEMVGAKVEFTGGYIGWTPNANSRILGIMKKTYKDMFKKDVHVTAVHAGLECGILSMNYPHWDMVSCGPSIYNPHSPDERVEIKTVELCWKFLLETLKNIS